MRKIIIIQARIGSTRLPEKVLSPLCGKPMLWHIVQRCQKVKDVDDVVVATSTSENDQKILTFCKEHHINCFLGDEGDVLSRFVEAANSYNADVIVRVTGDNPLTCPDFIFGALNMLIEKELDYVGVVNCPLGTGSEVILRQALDIANEEGAKPYDREHVTPFIYENKDKFKTGEYFPEAFLQKPAFRLTVDEDADYELMKKIYTALYREGEIISLAQVIALLEKQNDLLMLNRNVQQKTYRD